jgi:hypothetical protein
MHFIILKLEQLKRLIATGLAWLLWYVIELTELFI